MRASMRASIKPSTESITAWSEWKKNSTAWSSEESNAEPQSHRRRSCRRHLSDLRLAAQDQGSRNAAGSELRGDHDLDIFYELHRRRGIRMKTFKPFKRGTCSNGSSLSIAALGSNRFLRVAPGKYFQTRFALPERR